MRMRLGIVGVTGALALTAGSLLLQARAKDAAPQRVTITGQVIDLACYMRDPTHGLAAGHVTCAIKCANAGLPRGIYDPATKQVYLSLGKDMMGPIGMDVKDYMGKKVTATGLVFTRNGLRAIEVQAIKEVK